MQKNTVLKHKDADVIIEELDIGKRRIKVKLLNEDLFVPTSSCETFYSSDLIAKILLLKGPAYLCDEILRDESPTYVYKSLKYDLSSYVEEKEFEGKRLLDFGCGSGASTMILSKMFPDLEIVGVDLEASLLEIAKHRAAFYGCRNVKFKVSPNPNELPADIGFFDFVVLSAVYEHLLPKERAVLLPNIWNKLKPGGIIFLNQTPNRLFPVEVHTSGLPFINYLPDRIAHFVCRFSKRNLKGAGWNELLRRGIRGGYVKEILEILKQCTPKPVLLEPTRFGLSDRIDLWRITLSRSEYAVTKFLFLYLAKALKVVTGLVIVPHLALAIKKNEFEFQKD